MKEDLNVPEFDITKTPFIVERIKERLPMFLREIADMGDNMAEADAMLLGAITTLSAAMPNVTGRYGKKEVWANLFFFLSAPAATGKGKLGLCKNLVMPIHQERRHERKVKIDNIIAKLKAEGKKITPEDVNIPQKMLIIPGDSTSTAIYQGLGDNDGTGLISETEADTLVKAMTGEYGFSDGLRKAFHHEPISYFRRKENEMVEIMNPKLSVMLAGTPNQVFRMLPNAENGLFSRFMLYRMPRELEWNDVFEDDENEESYDDIFNTLGEKYLKFYKCMLKDKEKIRFVLQPQHKEKFNKKFAEMQQLLADIYGDEIVASVRRMGLIVYRIAMVLTTVRMMEAEPLTATDRMVCSDTDFDSALEIADVLIKHTIMIYQEMPEGQMAGRVFDEKTEQAYRLLGELPEQFTRVDALIAGSDLDLKRSTVDFYLRFMKETRMVICTKRGFYEKNEGYDKNDAVA